MLAPTADENVPFAQLVGLVVLAALQCAPAGHGVGVFKPSAPQYAPAGQFTHSTALFDFHVDASHAVPPLMSVSLTALRPTRALPL